MKTSRCLVLAFLGLVLTLQACARVVEPGDTEKADGVEEAVNDGEPADAGADGAPNVTEQCDADDYRGLIGVAVAEADLGAAERLRIYGEGDIITQEYLPRRTNIVYDARGIVRSVYCG